MLDRVTGMQIFSRVASLGGLSAAARAMKISPTLATKHIAALEERLGAKLLHRTTRRVSLTDIGRSYLLGVEKILRDLDEVESHASAERLDLSGTLRINAPMSFGVLVLAPLMVKFSRHYSTLHVDLLLNDRVVDLVEEDWDVAIRIGKLKDSNLVARKLANCRMVICAAPSYLSQHGIPRTVAELVKHNCLGYTLSQRLGADQWTFGTGGEITLPVRGTMRTNNGDALVAAAVAGHGVIYQPTFLVADAILAGKLIALVLDHPPIELHGIFSVFPANRSLPAKVRVFIDFLVNEFAADPEWDRKMTVSGYGRGAETTP